MGKVIGTIVDFYMSVRPQHTVMKIQDLKTVTCVQVLIKRLTSLSLVASVKKEATVLLPGSR